jgi:hypothetical protein
VNREGDEDVVVEYSDMKSETALKSELAKAIYISTTKSKSRHVGKIFLSFKKEMSFYETTYTLTSNLKKLFGAFLTI